MGGYFLPRMSRIFNVVESRPARLEISGERPERWNLTELAEQFGITRHAYMHGFHATPFAYIPKSNAFALSSRYMRVFPR